MIIFDIFIRQMSEPRFNDLAYMKNYFSQYIYNEGLPTEGQIFGLVGYTPETLPNIDILMSHGHSFYIFPEYPSRTDSIAAMYEPYMEGVRLLIVKSENFKFIPSSIAVNLTTPPEMFTPEVAEFVSTFRWISMDDMLDNLKRNKCLEHLIKFMKETQSLIADYTSPRNFREFIEGMPRTSKIVENTNMILKYLSLSKGLETRKQKFAIHGFTKDQIMCSYVFDVTGCQLIPITDEQFANKEQLYSDGIRLVIVNNPTSMLDIEAGHLVTVAKINVRNFDIQEAVILVSIRWMSHDEIVSRHEELRH